MPRSRKQRFEGNRESADWGLYLSLWKELSHVAQSSRVMKRNNGFVSRPNNGRFLHGRETLQKEMTFEEQRRMQKCRVTFYQKSSRRQTLPWWVRSEEKHLPVETGRKGVTAVEWLDSNSPCCCSGKVAPPSVTWKQQISNERGITPSTFVFLTPTISSGVITATLERKMF